MRLRMTISACLAGIGLAFSGAGHAAAGGPCGAGHLLTVEAGGAVSAGSKEALRAAVRDGTPIRVGWGIDFNTDGKHDVVHWADAVFLTIFEDEVFTQTPEINSQAPQLGQADIKLTPQQSYWQGLLGTTGRIEGRSRRTGELGTTPVTSWWCLDPRIDD